MSLKPIRDEIDRIDNQLIELFVQRMKCAEKVAAYKLENGMPVFNPEREQQVLDSVAERAGVYGNSARQLYAAVMELSRALQHDMLGSGEQLRNQVFAAQKELPYHSEHLKIACFGVPGTYAHQACTRIFPQAKPFFCPSFRDVFSAIQSGEAEFGVVPIENSTAGSVTDVYDLMLEHRFYIAAATDIAVNHCLCVKKGGTLNKIKKIFSHQQALTQCSDFIRSHPALQAEAYISTAAAAKLVAESDDESLAAICSDDAAEEYGLDIIMQGFQNNPNNTTRFMVISKELFIEDSADKISLCFSIPHRTGSLYSILCRFAANGLNLTKIESRPMFGASFEYLFYLDFTGNISTGTTLNLLCALSDELDEFSFLGNYKEL